MDSFPVYGVGAYGVIYSTMAGNMDAMILAQNEGGTFTDVLRVRTNGWVNYTLDDWGKMTWNMANTTATTLSLDVSTGGVFVATYEPSPPGTAVTLYFVLPDGYVVNAEGVVRWMRGATEDAPPGMGVAFANISRDALAHIAEFCANRPPLYFDE